MTPNPIPKVLSTLAAYNVRYLLIGGQACIIYGGAEFSRDIDCVVMIRDKHYWEPLRQELEQWRRQK